jgi:hypothetical protein
MAIAAIIDNRTTPLFIAAIRVLIEQRGCISAAFLSRERDFRNGSWLCENALATALTTRDFGEVAVFDHLAVFGGLFCLERLLTRIPAVLSGSATGYGHMSATTMPASPPAAVGRP